jgi:subtilase family serine protease
LLQHTRAALLAGVAAVALASCGQNTIGTQSGSSLPASAQSALKNDNNPQTSFHAVCDAATEGHATCFALVRDDAASKGVHDNLPSGYGPADLQSAYDFTPTGGAGSTVAIIDAYSNPDLAANVGVYRSTYSLPALGTCGSGSPCITIVNQTGGSSLPSANQGWGAEESLDVDMVSANCPNCNILVIEANSSSFSDLATAVQEAKTLKATTASNSYGGGESNGEDNGHSYQIGVPDMASTGDGGYGVEYPAASVDTIAVGGTTLRRGGNGKRPWTETVWRGAGSGCSAYVSKPSWQTDADCSKRTVGDISYEADPNTGVAVYDTYGYGGWTVFGGTSVASPAISSMFAASGVTAGINNASWIYVKKHHNKKVMNDITSGSNGSCGGTYLCTGVKGYDGPTGWGTPETLKGL